LCFKRTFIATKKFSLLELAQGEGGVSGSFLNKITLGITNAMVARAFKKISEKFYLIPFFIECKKI
jgi:hypothetical protein